VVHLAKQVQDALRVLPDLIVHSERAVYEYGRSTQACHQVSDLYQLARQVLKHVGRVDLGSVVSDRAMRYAEEVDDPLRIAAATWSLAHCMISDDMPAGSLEVAIKAAKPWSHCCRTEHQSTLALWRFAVSRGHCVPPDRRSLARP
jgi:hypothetical protein